ncbi:Tyrosine-protein kinase wzc [Pseudovibrio sp. Ad46]|uniref:GumC family protein n=1 Tax=Pseudovibrio sp. Ad46 TaxID=989432 RepID=UPI0007AEAF68|nr:polysaccharide biosynthesis tyrosine autokinase [Pseudovibrio sp. Ad46]KZK85643.1 Tyrosine-protein kinase wzc [Pseudovibrio sp. Ad46]
MQNSLASNATPEDTINLRLVFQYLRNYWSLILGVTGVVTILGVTLAFFAAPKYTAVTSVYIETRAENVVDVKAILSGFGSDNKLLQSQIEIIGSNGVAKRVINDHDLENSPEFRQVPSYLAELFAKITGEPPATTSLEQRVLDGLHVTLNRNTTVVDLSYQAGTPEMAAQLADGFAEAYLADKLATKFDSIRQASEWLSIRLAELGVKVRSSEQAVEQFRNEFNLQLAGSGTINEKQVATLNQQLVFARTKTAESQARVDQIEKVLVRGGSTSSFADAAQSAVITQLRAKASEVERKEAALTVKYSHKHPAVVSVRSQLTDLRAQIEKELQRIVDTAQNELAVAQRREASIAGSLEELRDVTNTENHAQVYLRELVREAAANRTLYESFLARLKETQEFEKMNSVSSRILSPAEIPNNASFPNKKLFLLVSAVLGLIIGTALALLIEQFDNTLKSKEDVEKRIGLPLFSQVPLIDGCASTSKLKSFLGFFASKHASSARGVKNNDALNNEITQFASANPLSHYAESIRELRSRVKFSRLDNPIKTLLITSAIPGEGKSTISRNLAHYTAKAGERVLFIDADMRRQISADAPGDLNEKSLADVLTGKVTFAEATKHEEGSNLYYLPAPSHRELWETAELLSSKAMKTLLDGASKSFDLVIIDSPPTLPLIDSRVLSHVVDATVLVASWNHTDGGLVEQAKDLLDQTPGKTLGVILNNFDVSKAKLNKHQASYGYGYYK